MRSHFKFLILPVFVFLSPFTFAQKTEQFFDTNWKECPVKDARYYSITEKNDSGFLRKDYYIRERKLQMAGRYKDAECKIKNGKFYFFYADGSPKSAGKYINGNKEGMWLEFHPNKMLKDSATYSHNKVTGFRIGWHSNGYVSDSIYFDPNGNGYSVSWFENGSINYKGTHTNYKMNGTWVYYHSNGKMSSIENYELGNLKDKKYFDENGIQLADTTNHDHRPFFGEKDDNKNKKWGNYLEKNLRYPEGQILVNGNTVTITICFTINEEGKVGDAYVLNPFSKEFDKAALDVVKSSPNWIPAVEHNRKVKVNYYQNITFKIN